MRIHATSNILAVATTPPSFINPTPHIKQYPPTSTADTPLTTRVHFTSLKFTSLYTNLPTYHPRPKSFTHCNYISFLFEVWIEGSVCAETDSIRTVTGSIWEYSSDYTNLEEDWKFQHTGILIIDGVFFLFLFGTNEMSHLVPDCEREFWLNFKIKAMRL